LPPGASGRLYDAAIGVLQSIRTLVDVAEDVLEDRRARLGHEDDPRGPWLRTEPQRGGGPSVEDASTVRDIPLAGT
jgi:hypothetical protein